MAYFKRRSFSEKELRTLRADYGAILQEAQPPKISVPGEDGWTKAAGRLQGSLRTDARAEAWMAKTRAATAKRVAISATETLGPCGASDARRQAVREEIMSRAATAASLRSAAGLGTAARAAMARAEASERAEQIGSYRERELARRILLRQQREAMWAAEQDQRQRQEQRRATAARAKEAREDAWRATLRKRGEAEQSQQFKHEWKTANRLADAAVDELNHARQVAANLIKIFDTDGNQRLDGAPRHHPMQTNLNLVSRARHGTARTHEAAKRCAHSLARLCVPQAPSSSACPRCLTRTAMASSADPSASRCSGASRRL